MAQRPERCGNPSKIFSTNPDLQKRTLRSLPQPKTHSSLLKTGSTSMSSNPNYDSELCGKVPIHLINTVQPYGVLLVLHRSTLRIIQTSENAATIFGIQAPDLVKTTIKDHLDADALEFLKQVTKGKSTDKIPQIWTIKGQKYLCIL